MVSLTLSGRSQRLATDRALRRLHSLWLPRCFWRGALDALRPQPAESPNTRVQQTRSSSPRSSRSRYSLGSPLKRRPLGDWSSDRFNRRDRRSHRHRRSQPPREPPFGLTLALTPGTLYDGAVSYTHLRAHETPE